MKKILSILLIAPVLFIISCGPIGEAGPSGNSMIPIVFQQGSAPYAGYAGVMDTFITQYDPNENYGSCDVPYLGFSGLYIRRILVKFDIDGMIPAGAVIQKAYLSFYVISVYGTATNNFQVYNVTKAWTEGTGDCSGSSSNDVTWNNYTTATGWTSVGGDFDAAAVSDVLNPPLSGGDDKFYSFELNNSLIEGWISDPSSNNGLIIKADRETSPTGYLRVYTSDYTTDTSLRPKLTIYYTVD